MQNRPLSGKTALVTGSTSGIGLGIAHAQYHKHGAYILDHADITGFAIPELHRLGQLVLGHRGKLRKLDFLFDDVGFCCQLMCLRLAVILCHARRDPDTTNMQISMDAKNSHFVAFDKHTLF